MPPIDSALQPKERDDNAGLAAPLSVLTARKKIDEMVGVQFHAEKSIAPEAVVQEEPIKELPSIVLPPLVFNEVIQAIDRESAKSQDLPVPIAEISVKDKVAPKVPAKFQVSIVEAADTAVKPIRPKPEVQSAKTITAKTAKVSARLRTETVPGSTLQNGIVLDVGRPLRIAMEAEPIQALDSNETIKGGASLDPIEQDVLRTYNTPLEDDLLFDARLELGFDEYFAVTTTEGSGTGQDTVAVIVELQSAFVNLEPAERPEAVRIIEAFQELVQECSEIKAVTEADIQRIEAAIVELVSVLHIDINNDQLQELITLIVEGSVSMQEIFRSQLSFDQGTHEILDSTHSFFQQINDHLLEPLHTLLGRTVLSASGQ